MYTSISTLTAVIQKAGVQMTCTIIIIIIRLQTEDSNTHRQRIWDKVVVDSEYDQLLSKYTDPYHRARLLAVAAPHSGDWLHTLPISACGLHLEDI